ncbi:hypothetical protein H0H92_007557 [Tricholoma furcatifolium]|nr:hypothetical protein H0H92_007557 [Tricholoma furcatifolium]
MAETVLELSKLISDSISELVETCGTYNLRIPNLNEVYTPESEAFRKNQTVARAVNIAAAAAFQLAAILLPPQESVMQITSGHLCSAALRVSIESHVPEILEEAGVQGMHANEIASKTGIDGEKLARLLRLLANRHVYREVGPDVFANNRISSTLSTGKTFEKIMEQPISKFDDTDGFCAMNELLLTDNQKASSYLLENMTDPKTSHSYEPQHSPLQRALGFKTNFWEFHARPENAYRLRRFGIAMRGSTVMDLPDLLLELFDWSSLPEDALVIDCGGGIGSSARTVLKAHPKLKFLIQDMPNVVEDGKRVCVLTFAIDGDVDVFPLQHWNETDPSKLQSGRVDFMGEKIVQSDSRKPLAHTGMTAHNFFEPQPVRNASVFLLKNVLHDWSDDNCIQILSGLRAAATSETTLVICDCVMTTSGVETVIDTISNKQGLNPPAVLSTGFTTVGDMPWALDATMMAMHNTQEHTLLQFNKLLTSAGWGITRVVLSGSSIDSVHAQLMNVD